MINEIQAQMKDQSLADWLNREILESKLSIRDFALKSRIGFGTVDNILNSRGEYPSMKTLVRLADYTKTDLCSLIALIAPDQVGVNPDVMILAQRISRLPSDMQASVDAHILGLMLQGGNKSVDTG